MSPQYRDRTLTFLSQLRQQTYEEVQRLLKSQTDNGSDAHRVLYEDAQVIYSEDGNGINEVVFPDNQARANSIFLKPLDDGLKRGELASIYNVSPSHFSMIINVNSLHRVSRDLILCAALLTSTPIPLEEVDHVLMELEYPGLFIDTYDRNENKRNFILRRILEYGQTHTYPDYWLSFARGILSYLNLEIPGGSYKKLSIPILTPEEMELADQWEQEAVDALQDINYMVLRHHFLADHMEAMDVHSRSTAVQDLAMATFLSEDAIKRILTANTPSPQSHGSRESLIRLAAELGCTLDEANLMLRQANLAVIYPLRKNLYEMAMTLRLLENAAAT